MEMEHFKTRHIGIKPEDLNNMLQTVGVSSVDELINQTIPADIRLKKPLSLPKAQSEMEYAEDIARIASANKIFTSYIGMGWYDTITPAAMTKPAPHPE